MRSSLPTIGVCAVLLTALDADAQSAYDPKPYLQASDGPFAALTFSYLHLEDFEDLALNTPGVVANGGAVIGNDLLVDSVDADDGVIDGSGAAGHSFLISQGSAVSFTFDANVLGALPTHAGVVVTDVGFAIPTAGFATITLEAFDALGASLGTSTPTAFGDGSATSATAEDRFVGFRHSAGIARIEIRADSSNDWEIDHLQYGRALGVYGAGCKSSACAPFLFETGVPSAGGSLALRLEDAPGGALAIFAIGNQKISTPLAGGCALLISPALFVIAPIALPGVGPCGSTYAQTLPIPLSLAGSTFTLQTFVADPTAVLGFVATNGLEVIVP